MAEKKKILIVDDEEDSLFYLSRILENNNFDVISTSKGQEAVFLAQKHIPDLIILDVVMPVVDGGEVAALLKEHNSTKDIPVIFLTALLQKKEELPEIKTGKFQVVAKPVTDEEILKAIKQTLY